MSSNESHARDNPLRYAIGSSGTASSFRVNIIRVWFFEIPGLPRNFRIVIVKTAGYNGSLGTPGTVTIVGVLCRRALKLRSSVDGVSCGSVLYLGHPVHPGGI
jgi:hypothetical protein